MEWLLGKQLWLRVAAWIEGALGLSSELLGNILNTVVIVLFYLALRRLLKVPLLRRIEEPNRRYRVSKAINYSLGFFSSLMILKVWLLGRANLATYLGILSAGLAIALQDVIANFAGWLFVLMRQPFKVGDRIQIGEHTGDVVDIRMFMFTMLEVGNWVAADQSTGRIIHLPNGQLFKQSCANYTQGFEYVWNEVPVIVTFESDWELAHSLLTEIVEQESEDVSVAAAEQVHQVAEHFKISFKHLTPIVWIEVVDIGVKLTLRYLCRARARRSTADRIWRRVLQAFDGQSRIDFAYPTQRFFNNSVEGKPGTSKSSEAPDSATSAAISGPA